MRNNKKTGLGNHYTLSVRIFVTSFFVQLFSMAISGGIILALVHHGFLEGRPAIGFLLVILISSLLIGGILNLCALHYISKPFKKLEDATREVAAGNFDIRISVKGPQEVEALAQSFNLMAEELGGIETLRSDFISNVSHEFKTPVASIGGFAKLLKKEDITPEKRRKYTDIIIKESKRLSALTGNILFLSKLERQGIMTDNTHFLLDEQIRQAVLFLEPEWSRKSQEIATELFACSYFGNEEMLMQVWVNLIGNAIKFTGDAGTIRVRTRRAETEEEGIIVTIEDDGIGMDPSAIKHIFDKFYQCDTSHSVEGNGLGLPMVKRILEISGGTISVISEKGTGTCVSVRLPLGRA